MNDLTSTYKLHELRKESTMGSYGTETQRDIRIIDLSNFETRMAEIANEIWQASIEIGFFQLKNHGIPQQDINDTFELMEKFFALPNATKAKYPLSRNAGWESRKQIRPSTNTADQKESYQITRPLMTNLWPSDEELPNFKAKSLAFERQCWQVGMKVLSCFAYKLGFDLDFFTKAHNPNQPDYQSTLRMPHYYTISDEMKGKLGLWRAGAHTDFDCLTLLFQRKGQGGLQVCPGKDMTSQTWTSITPYDDIITCNIGDMLMRWSDDILPSNFHRVKSPEPDEYQGARYSLAFFCQANAHVIIEGPNKKYSPITAADYLKQRISANFSGKY